MVEGYDAADPERASILALGEEWMDGGPNTQAPIIGGYGALVELLTAECRNHDVAMHISAQPSPPSKRTMGGGWSVAPKATLMSAMP
jgi:hypothetical protein